MQRSRPPQGFTLVELLVVIGIIGLLITLLVPTVSRAMLTIQASGTRNTIKNLEVALEAFRADFKQFPPSKPGTLADLSVGPMKTGAANLVYYLRGPAESGWGQSVGLMPFTTGSIPARTYGPHFQAAREACRYERVSSTEQPVGVLDGFKPAGVILYFRADKDASGETTYRWADNNRDGLTDRLAKTNYSSQDVFEKCVAIRPTIIVVGQSYNLKYVRQDYLLVSPGVDGRYGPVKVLANGEIVPDTEGSGNYDDIANWN